MKDFRPDDTIGLSREDIEEKYRKLHDEFKELQEEFYASEKYVPLIILQGIDCSGKDGTVWKAPSGINSNGFYAKNLKAPTSLELNYDCLQHVYQKTPKRGDIVVFNRSYYKDVLATRVYKAIDDETARSRFDEIREFEKYLVNNDTTLPKFLLYISKDFQQKKLEERLEAPEKSWKLSMADLKERRFWDEYQRCYSDMLSRCSTKKALWYVVSANRRWSHDYSMLSIIVKAFKEFSLEFPAVDGDAWELIREVKNNKQFQTTAEATRPCLQRGCVLFF